MVQIRVAVGRGMVSCRPSAASLEEKRSVFTPWTMAVSPQEGVEHFTGLGRKWEMFVYTCGYDGAMVK